eukprot:scaffold8793_cov133-Skeletonema_marinoi.AAC.2
MISPETRTRGLARSENDPESQGSKSMIAGEWLQELLRLHEVGRFLSGSSHQFYHRPVPAMIDRVVQNLRGMISECLAPDFMPVVIATSIFIFE